MLAASVSWTSLFSLAQAEPWAWEPCGKYSAPGGLGGVQLVLGEAQVEGAAALQGPPSLGTPTSWAQALRSGHGERG